MPKLSMCGFCGSIKLYAREQRAPYHMCDYDDVV